MSRHTSLVLAVIVSAVLAASLVPPAWAVPGICLSRSPAPPSVVLNNGTSKVRFDWTIETGAGIVCSTPYTFEILDTNQNVLAGFPVNFTCPGVNPFSNFFEWTVPQGQACGCYYGRLRFYSNWCNGSARKIEDEALTAFIVGASATVTVCKFLDVNGDGVKDPTDPPIQGWQFCVQTPFIQTCGTTGQDGCYTFNLQVNCVGTTQVCITDVLPPGWVKTGPQGSTNPICINVSAGSTTRVEILNWQPIIICGNKWLDQAPWPWTDPHYVGPQGQQNVNTAICMLEPTPNCALQNPPAPCVSPTQNCPAQGIVATGIPNVTVQLFDNTDPNNPLLLATTTTGSDGSFCFGPLQWRQNFKIVMANPAPSPPTCNPPIAGIAPPIGPLSPWPGAYIGTVATSVWPCPNNNFTDPHTLELTLPTPVQVNQTFGCNYFFNRQPSRLFGTFCEDARTQIPNITVGVGHQGFPYPTPSVSAQADGAYIVPEISLPPLQTAEGGLRPGVYTLTPPALPDPTTQSWTVTTYCDTINGNSTFTLATPSLDVGVGHSADVRVDFCITGPPNRRRCFMPVTFTQKGWHDFCDPNNPIITGGMMYSRFPIAFANFSYFLTIYNNKMIIGHGKTITWDGTTGGLTRLCLFLPQTGACGKLDTNYLNPWTLPSGVGGALAGELAALQMNIAYNDRRLMPRTPGYDLELFRLATGLFKGKSVAEVRNIANSVLGGAPPSSVGLTNCQQLVDILAAINGNYEFLNFDTFIDNGYLIPNVPFALSGPPVPVIVP